MAVFRSIFQKMAKSKVYGSIKRFGARYGRTTKHKRAAIEKDQKAPQVCPYCNKPRAKRQAMGIYECGKCGSKFTGGAYTVKTRMKLTTATEEQAQIREVEIKTRTKAPEEA